MDPDSSLTFDTLIVGPANRLASAAARRAAESPGTTYNPLFVYSEPGLGKSHILSAIVRHAQDNHARFSVLSRSSEEFLQELAEAIEDGAQDAFRDHYLSHELMILDDVQTLADHPEGQEMLLRLIDELSGKGAQIVLASDQPPAEIEGLDGRLIRRFSDGLIVDLGVPDYEMRLAIATNKAEESEASFGPGVLEALARGRFKDVRKLQEALRKIVSVQRTGRTVGPEDLKELFGDQEWAPRARKRKKSASSKKRVEKAAPPPVEWRAAVQAVVDSARIDSIAATPLAKLLEESESPIGWRTTLREFAERANRVREIREELRSLGDPWPETAAGLLTDTRCLEEAENLLTLARELMRPFPSLPDGMAILGMAGRFPTIALKAAEQLIREVSTVYNPLFIHSPDSARASEFMLAAGRSFLTVQPQGIVAHASASEFAQELVHAITSGVAGAWRERWWSVDLLLLHGVQRMPETGRAQDEFFHLFQALGSRGARVILAADRAPGQITGIPERLALKLEEGFVTDLGTGVEEPDVASDVSERVEAEAGAGPTGGSFQLDPERMVWHWPVIEDRIADPGDSRVVGSSHGN